MKKLLLIILFNLINADLMANEISKKYIKKTDNLTEFQKYVMEQNGTEPAFRNEFWNNKRDGIYVDASTGEPLFSSTDKYDSGSGWPSFTKPIDSKMIITKIDNAHNMVRQEVRSKHGNSHLGHVFDDGPKEQGGMRYCINSASLRFIPRENLVKEGYDEYEKLFKK